MNPGVRFIHKMQIKILCMSWKWSTDGSSCGLASSANQRARPSFVLRTMERETKFVLGLIPERHFPHIALEGEPCGMLGGTASLQRF